MPTVEQIKGTLPYHLRINTQQHMYMCIQLTMQGVISCSVRMGSYKSCLWGQGGGGEEKL